MDAQHSFIGPYFTPPNYLLPDRQHLRLPIMVYSVVDDCCVRSRRDMFHIDRHYHSSHLNGEHGHLLTQLTGIVTKHHLLNMKLFEGFPRQN